MGTITEVEMINKKTGQTKILFKRKDSYCHFMDEFRFGKFFIQLRLDEKDRDGVHQEPTLDADIYTEYAVSGKKIKYKSGKDMWHHTSIEKDEEGNLIYYFSFKSLELVLRRRITIEEGLACKVKIISGSVKP